MKNPAAVALGRKGGKKGAQNLSAQELSEQARKAGRGRWKAVSGVLGRRLAGIDHFGNYYFQNGKLAH